MKKFLCMLLAIVCLIPTVCLAGCSDNKDDAKSVANRVYHIQSCKEDLVSTTSTYNEGALKIYFYDNTFKLEYTSKENAEINGYYIGEYTTEDNIVTLDIQNQHGYFLTGALSYDVRKLTFDSLTYSAGTLKFEDIVDGKLVQFVFEEATLEA